VNGEQRGRSVQTLIEQVEALSLSREATAHWIDFLARSLAMLGIAESMLRREWPSFLLKIKSRNKTSSKLHIPEEPDITVEIGHLLRKAITALPLDDPMFVVSVHMEDPCESPRRTGKYSERIDLSLYDPLRRLDLKFEAKRLIGSNADDYTGAEGMGRFTSPQPHSRAPIAGMIGYILDKDLGRWVAAIEAQAGKTLLIEATAGSPECCVRYSVESRIASALPNLLLIHRLIDYVGVCAAGGSQPSAKAQA
jgi:hypothetical protein